MSTAVAKTEVQVLDAGALATVTKSEIEMQLAAAERRPRVVSQFLDEVRSIACVSEKVAESAFYRLKRRDKDGADVFIEGPSVRLAEIVASRYRNLRVGGRVVEINATHVVAEGICHDLETNTSVQTETRRRITGKYGRRYSDDMIAVTAQAAVSIAVRNAVFRVVPRALIEPIVDDCKAAALGRGTVEQKRADAVKYFTSKGATEAELLTYLGRRRIEDVGVEDILTLRGLANAIRDGETTLEEELRPKPTASATTASSDILSDAVAAAAENPAAPEEGQPAETEVELDPGAEISDEEDIAASAAKQDAADAASTTPKRRAKKGNG